MAGPSKAVILKPPGQATRISRNGYNLKAKLEWSDAQYKRVQVTNLSTLVAYVPMEFQDFVHIEAKRHLQLSLSYAEQNSKRSAWHRVAA